MAGLWRVPVGSLETLRGVEMLIGGVLGVVFLQVGAFGWLANPSYFIALALLFWDRPVTTVFSRLLVIGALGLALASLPLTNWFPYPADEGGVCYHSAIRPAIGYWLWLGAILVLGLGAFSPLRTAPAAR